jgi:hypothetical protein
MFSHNIFEFFSSVDSNIFIQLKSTIKNAMMTNQFDDIFIENILKAYNKSQLIKDPKEIGNKLPTFKKLIYELMGKQLNNTTSIKTIDDIFEKLYFDLRLIRAENIDINAITQCMDKKLNCNETILKYIDKYNEIKGLIRAEMVFIYNINNWLSRFGKQNELLIYNMLMDYGRNGDFTKKNETEYKQNI